MAQSNQSKRQDEAKVLPLEDIAKEDDKSSPLPKSGTEKKNKSGKGRGGKRKQLRKWRKKAMVTEAELRAARAEMAQLPAFPVARPSQFKRRHWGLVASFVVMVLAPLAVVAFYLFGIAKDQYLSTTGFTVRSQQSSGANDLLGGLATFTGNSAASDSDILYEYIRSQEMVVAVRNQVDLQAHYGQFWEEDPVFSLQPEATLEELVSYWRRVIQVAYDSGSGLIEVQVQAFDPDTAQTIGETIVDASQTRINALNEQAREDAMRYARIDLDEAIEQLKGAREALTQFRTRTRIVDPEADIQSRMGVMSNLQQQLAEALIQYDLLVGAVAPNDPRVKQAQQQIDVIRDRIDLERQSFTSKNTDTGAVGEDYPTLIAEFERLSVDLEYAEESYRAGLTALATARDDSTRQGRYLATYVRPTRAEASQYPNRFVLVGLAGLFLLLAWSVVALIYYSIRDRS